MKSRAKRGLLISHQRNHVWKHPKSMRLSRSSSAKSMPTLTWKSYFPLQKVLRRESS